MKTNKNKATDPLKEIEILLGAGLYWLNADADAEHQDPKQEAEDCFLEAHQIVNSLLKEKL